MGDNIRYSFKVDIKNLQAKRARLEYDLLNNPDNEKIKEMIKQLDYDIKWHQDKLREGIGTKARWE